ncbi:MAG: sugar phosphate nucleotidyltransferase [Actinomycetota bacterium]|nr:sugar phosphate nucleotidyltransferase [Actinomycetota bacterium]
MKAVIMAGGEGTRLRPLTATAPKPMLPIANRPMLLHIIELLKKHGIDEVVITVAFMANAIRTYFGDGSEFGIRISYANEDSPLGTAGSVGNCREQLDSTFLVISGDVLTDIDISALVKFHVDNEAMATIGLKSMENPLEFGIVTTNEDGTVGRFLEKPTWGQVFSDTINTGIYVLEPDIFSYIPVGKVLDFSQEVFPKILEDDKSIHAMICEGYWEDVGTLEAYLSVHTDILTNKVNVELDGFMMDKGIYLGDGSEIHPTALVEGPVVIGDNCRIGPDARVRPYSVIGSNSRISTSAEIDRSVLHENVYIGEGSLIRGTIVGKSCDIRRSVHSEDGVVLGSDCYVGDGAQLFSKVKVYPSKTVQSGATVLTSIVWESKGTRSVFSPEGVMGIANVDIGPELALRLAMAFGSTLKPGSKISTARDSSRAARMLKRAIMVGLNAVGIDVADLEVAPIPALRYHVKNTSSKGGVAVVLDPRDPESVVIRFVDQNGVDLDEASQRKIERGLAREDYRNVLASELGELDFPARNTEFYTQSLLEHAQLGAIRDRNFKFVVDYGFGVSSHIFPSVLAKLGGDVLGINPFSSTKRIIDSDPLANLTRLSDLVVNSRSEFGVAIDPVGERITLVDNSGRILSGYESQIVFARLMAEANKGAKIAAPVGSPLALAKAVERFGGELTYTKRSTSGLMEAGTKSTNGCDLVAGVDGNYIFPDFLPGFDGCAALVQLLSLLAVTGHSLSHVASEVDQVRVVSDSIVTPWESKGMVMRILLDGLGDRHTILLDGIYVEQDDTWYLVVPDPVEPVTHIFVEGKNEMEALAILNRLRERISIIVSDASGGRLR